jgi:prophage regulatory protein
MSRRLIPYEELGAKGIRLSRVQLWRLERAGKFPRRVPTSPGRHAWVEEEIDQHIEALIAARDAAAA